MKLEDDTNDRESSWHGQRSQEGIVKKPRNHTEIYDEIRVAKNRNILSVVCSENALPAEDNDYLTHSGELDELESLPGKAKLVWGSVIFFTYIHMAAISGIFMTVTLKIMWQTLVFALGLHIVGVLGTTAGAHRCFAHKSFKVKTPLKILLVLMQTVAFQKSIYLWVRDHRVHHKYSDTNADPHNAKRGFFFSHIGWLLVRKHELVRVRGKQIDMSDIESDPILMFQKNHHLPLGILLCFAMQAYVPYKLWGESLLGGFLVAGILRFVVTLHVTWLVNSAAHIWGAKPYDKSINPTDNKPVAFLAFGEGWYNYHHTFPWDYKTAELGNYFKLYYRVRGSLGQYWLGL